MLHQRQAGAAQRFILGVDQHALEVGVDRQVQHAQRLAENVRRLLDQLQRSIGGDIGDVQRMFDRLGVRKGGTILFLDREDGTVEVLTADEIARRLGDAEGEAQ